VNVTSITIGSYTAIGLIYSAFMIKKMHDGVSMLNEDKLENREKEEVENVLNKSHDIVNKYSTKLLYSSFIIFSTIFWLPLALKILLSKEEKI
jgi:hypothetical protein